MNNTYKTNKTNWRRLGRSVLLVALLFAAGGPAWAQRNYIFYNATNGYISNKGGTLGVSSTFKASCAWVASGELGTTSRTIYSYVDNTKYLRGGESAYMSLGNSQNNWQSRNGYLTYRSGTTNHWVIYYSDGNLATLNNTSFNRFAPTQITINEYTYSAVTASISGNDAISSTGNYSYTGNTGTETKSYTRFTVNGNYYYWYDYDDQAVAPTNQAWGTITKTWSLLGADGYATVNSSTGEVTVSNVPTIPLVITLVLVAEDGTNSVTVTKAISLSNTPSSASSGIVTINDLEDHTWTYYSGVGSSVDGGNYNTNYGGKIYSPNPRNVKITYRGKNDVANSTTVVKVSRTENDSVFIYYKTLEEGSTSGEYPYKVISNPFSVRPSTGSGNSKVYYGFAGWKIVSGGEYIKNHSNNDVLTLDEEIVFNNLPYPSVNCTSAEIVFQTTWTQANVQTGNNIGTMFGQFSGGTYETNFAVLTSSYTTGWTGNKNATVTSVLPDGSTDYSSGVYTRLNLTLNSGFTVKYEYIHINDNTTTFSMGTGTKTLYIGRGVSNTTANGVCCDIIQGYDGSINSGGLTYTLKIESGIYNNLSYIKGYEGSTTTNTVTGSVSVKGVLGCDYDRAKGINSNLKIQNNIIMGYAYSTDYTLLLSATAGQEVLNVTFKSGSLNSNMTSAGAADASESFYIGIGGGYSAGYRIFTMEGGEMWSLAAGLCNNTATTNSIRFRIKGGLIKGSIYGSAANANSYGYKTMVLTGGQVKGWIAGGGNGTSANGGLTTGSSYLYVGGNCRVNSEGSNIKINSSRGGNVFGSGSGIENTTTWGEMRYGTNVVIADNAYIERNVFGGGNFGWTDEHATIYLTGTGMSVGNVFGGANQNKGEYVDIYMTGGHVREGLYGGSNVTGDISDQINIDIFGTSPQDGNTYAVNQVFGGGNQADYSGTPTVTVHCGADASTPISIEEVYGGGNQASVTGTNVTIEAGNIIGDVYGGGRQANVGNNGTSVTVNGGIIRRVFGGNNISGTIAGGTAGKITVSVDKTSSCPMKIGQVFGGGNRAASQVGSITVGCTGDLVTPLADGQRYGYDQEGIGAVYGGANNADIDGNITLNIVSGIVDSVFGGNNAGGDIDGDITVTINKNGSAPCANHWYVGYVFGGGNNAAYSQKTADHPAVNVQAGLVTNHVFGGGNGSGATVTGNPTVTLSGTAQVGGNVFGGGNAAAVTGNTSVKLQN